MPRTNVLRQVDREKLTPFASLIYDYLVSFQPSKTVTEFADESGVSANTITSWLKHGTAPLRSSVVKIAERVPDLPLDELLRAAGLPTTEQVRRARLAHLGMLHASIDEVMANLRADPTIPESDLAAFERVLRRKPEEFIAATDTWREYRHESPAAFAAQQAEATAEVFPAAPIATAEEAHGHPRRRHHTEQPRRTTGA